MVLKELLAGTKYKVIQGTDGIPIDFVAWDSRKIKPHSLFICIKGLHADGHDFAWKAVADGALALVAEREVGGIAPYTSLIKVDNSRMAMASIANLYYGEPSKRFNLIGITGTNGKTSVSWFIARILENAGRKAGIIGTIENRVGDKLMKVEKLNPTTPDALELQATFREMLDEGVTDVAMEVTSAALVSHRVDHCHFKVGVFTNLSQDHLDLHGSMENYKQAKMRLFKMCRYGVLNADDPAHLDIWKHATCDRVMTYGIHKAADLRGENIRYDLDGVSFTLNFYGIKQEVRIKVPGRFSVYNALAAMAACYLAGGLTLEQALEGVQKIEGVRGRFESVPNRQGYRIVVDYANTPDGLDNILRTARGMTKGRVIAVFGCGGDRDRAKRPLMGEIAGRWADFCIITSDNPRNEEPQQIMDDIETGLQKTGCMYEKIEDRRTAIFKAIEAAKPGDIVVIAGKGHETYQVFAKETVHFDDREVVEEYFRDYCN